MKKKHFTTICREIYENQGQHATLEYINQKLRLKSKEYRNVKDGYCNGCMTISYFWNNQCLVCGQAKENPKKVAKLVSCSLKTRVIVDKNTTYDEIIDAAKQKFVDKIYLELWEHIEDVEDDEECPFNPDYDL